MTARQLRAFAFDAIDAAPEHELAVEFEFERTPLVTNELVRDALGCFERSGWRLEWSLGQARGGNVRVWLNGARVVP